MKIVLLGQIASGKGTLSQKLQEEFGFEAISIGHLLREECKKNTPEAKAINECLEKGQLVSNELAIAVLKRRLQELGDKNIIFDGYPRNIVQAQTLATVAKIDCVLVLNVPDDVVKERFMGRRECTNCGFVSNIKFESFNLPCPRCGGAFGKRNDLNEEAMQNKMRSFEKDTKPLVEFYKQFGIAYEIDASQNADVTYKQAKNIIKQYL